MYLLLSVIFLLNLCFSYTIRFGSQYLYGREEFGVSTIKYHEKWDPDTFANDIAILTLSKYAQKVQMIQYIGFIVAFRDAQYDPVCLPVPGQRLPRPGEELEAAGWGRTISDPKLSYMEPNTLQYVTLPRITQKDCKERKNKDPEGVMQQ